jgi:transposase InsO family protein
VIHPGQIRGEVYQGLGLLLRVPNRIITDNGSQFTSGLFKSY